jgi:hypothetical protein
MPPFGNECYYMNRHHAMPRSGEGRGHSTIAISAGHPQEPQDNRIGISSGGEEQFDRRPVGPTMIPYACTITAAQGAHGLAVA